MPTRISQINVDLGATLTDFNKGMRAAEARVRKTADGIADVGSRLTRAVTVPLGIAGGAALTFSGQFEQALTKSTAIMGDLSDEMRQKMVDAAREVSESTTFSSRQAAEAFFFLASAGLDASQSLEALPKVAAFATAGNFDLATATDLVTDAQSALGLSVEDTVENMRNMERVSDVLVKANTLSNASVQQFAESLTGQAGPALRQFGKDIEEGVAVLAAYADQGVKAEEASTKLFQVLRDLSRMAIKNADAFDDAGVAVFDSAGEMRNLADIVEDLEERLSGASDETQRLILQQLGLPSKSQSAILSLIGFSDAIREYEEELRNAQGTTEEVAQRSLDNLADQFQITLNEAQNLAISIGDTLTPAALELNEALSGAIDVLAGLVESFRDLDQDTQDLVLRIGALAGSIGPALLAFAGLSKAVKLAQVGFESFIAFIKTTPGALIALTAALGAAVSEFIQYRKAIEGAEEAQRRLAEQDVPAVARAVLEANRALDENREKLAEVARAIVTLENDLARVENAAHADLIRGQLEQLRATAERLRNESRGLVEGVAGAQVQAVLHAFTEQMNEATRAFQSHGNEVRYTTELLDAHGRALANLVDIGNPRALQLLEGLEQRATLLAQRLRELKTETDTLAGDQGEEGEGRTFAGISIGSEEEQEQLLERHKAFMKKMAGVGREAADTQAAAWQDMFDRWGDGWSNINELARSTLANMTRGFGQAVAQMIVQGANFERAMIGFLQNVASTFISLAIEMMVQWIAAKLTEGAAGAIAAHASVPFIGLALGLGAAAAITAAILASGQGAESQARAAAPRTARLAEGGVVMDRIIAEIGEGSEPEVVAPLSRLEKLLPGTGRTRQEVLVSLDGRVIGQAAAENLPEALRVNLGTDL